MAIYHVKNILVTGGAGFIGCNFVNHLLAENPEVHIVNLDKLTYAGTMDNLTDLPDPGRHTFVHGDICDRPALEDLVREHEIDTVIHFAAESHVDRSITGPSDFIYTNIIGTFTLLEVMREYWLKEKGFDATDCRFHHISTDEVYGSLTKDDTAFTEDSPYQPNSPYSASKASSDHLLRSYFHTYQLPVIITNCTNNYGPHQHPEKFIPKIIQSCVHRQPFPVYGDGSNIRDWLYVTDHCEALLKVLINGKLGECYNIGGKTQVSNNDIASLITAEMDKHIPENAPHSQYLEYVTDRPGHDWRYAMDISKIEKELKWSPKETLESGIQKTVKWYLAQT